MYYTYVLQSEVDNQFYVGYSKDLKLRFEKHKDGYIESTKRRRPLKLIYYEACLTQQDALQREKYLKTWHGRQYLQQKAQILFNRVNGESFSCPCEDVSSTQIYRRGHTKAVHT